MDCSTIKQRFDFCAAANGATREPLYLVLSRVLSETIDTMRHGDRFPSERELAAALQLNRSTVRKAVAPLTESGRLIRCKNDTLVGAETALPGRPAVSEHLSETMIFGLAPQHEITLLVYETFEFQLDFWRRITGEFNKLNPFCKITPLVFPGKLGTTRSILGYLDYIRSGKCDLALLPSYYLWPDDLTDFIHPVSASLRELENNSDYRSAALTNLVPGYLNSAVPFAVNGMIHFWNKKFLRIGGVDMRTAPFDTALAAAVKHLPDAVGIVPDYFDLCWDKGIPVSADSRQILTQCEAILNRFDLAREREKCFTGTDEPYLLMLNRKGGDLLCRPNLVLGERFGDALAEHFTKALIRFDPDTMSWCGLSALAVTRNCRDKQFAELFLEYLLSDDVQNRIWKLCNMFPVKSGALKTVDFAPLDALEETISHLKVAPISTEKSNFGVDRHDESCSGLPHPRIPERIPVGCVMLRFLQDYLRGKVSRDEITKHVARFFRLDL